MTDEQMMKVANDISDKLIRINTKNTAGDKTLLQLYYELLGDKYKGYETSILTYLPERLAAKGYEIVNQKWFQLKKY